MAFTFGFGGDDIDTSQDDSSDVHHVDGYGRNDGSNEPEAPPVDVQAHDLKDWVGLHLFPHLFSTIILYI